MKVWLGLGMIAASLCLSAAPAPASPPAPDGVAIEALVTAIFAPYRKDTNTIASWEHPVFSRETSALIREWQSVVPEGEPDALNDGDWFCQCQDWDHRAFAARILSIRFAGAERAAARVRVRLDRKTEREATMLFRREGSEWRLDEMRSASFPQGLKQALRETIAEDRKLARP